MGNKSGNYVGIVEQLLSSYRALECNILLKLLFLHSHFDFFTGNMAAFSDEVRIYREWNEDTEAKGTQICWLTTAVQLYGRHQQKNMKRQKAIK
jgi:hypothetical protein